MELICKEYKKCIYKDKCDHAKPHKLIKQKNTTANNCILHEMKEVVIMGHTIKCHCVSSIMRKRKLNKINNI